MLWWSSIGTQARAMARLEKRALGVCVQNGNMKWATRQDIWPSSFVRNPPYIVPQSVLRTSYSGARLMTVGRIGWSSSRSSGLSIPTCRKPT